MGLLISKEDFVGTYAIAQNAYTKLDQWILQFEEKYLIELMGATLFDLFKADVNPITKQPSNPVYLAIYSPFHIDVSRCLHISAGMKEMLLGYVYYQYTSDAKEKNTISGPVVNQVETAREASHDESNIYSRYNMAHDTAKEIQWYMCEYKKIDYPFFNGKRGDNAHWCLT